MIIALLCIIFFYFGYLFRTYIEYNEKFLYKEEVKKDLNQKLTESFTNKAREQGSEALSNIPNAIKKTEPKREKKTESFTNKGAKQASENLKKIPNPYEHKPMSSDTPGLRALQEGYKPPRATMPNMNPKKKKD